MFGFKKAHILEKAFLGFEKAHILTLIADKSSKCAAPGIVNPFEHTQLDCWTLVDFDRDGDLDLVKVGPPKPAFGLVREVRYYENATWNQF